MTDTILEMKAYTERSIFSELAIAGMLGMHQSAFNMILNDNYPHESGAQQARMMNFINTKAPSFEAITIELKKMTLDNYGEDFPDILVLRRMYLHRKRSELMNDTPTPLNRYSNKKRIPQPSTSGASL